MTHDLMRERQAMIAGMKPTLEHFSTAMNRARIPKRLIF
jgi:hypothetical protein